jgi:excisionase family DNA binding protein
VSEFALQLPVGLLEAIVEQATERALERLRAEQINGNGCRWLYGAQAAADYLGWPVGRVQKLTAAKVIPHHRVDGEQRVSYRTDELDAWLDQFYEGPSRLRG